jgi:hypothetical protein
MTEGKPFSMGPAERPVIAGVRLSVTVGGDGNTVFNWFRARPQIIPALPNQTIRADRGGP